jgi:hypothetical protein
MKLDSGADFTTVEALAALFELLFADFAVLVPLEANRPDASRTSLVAVFVFIFYYTLEI